MDRDSREESAAASPRDLVLYMYTLPPNVPWSACGSDLTSVRAGAVLRKVFDLEVPNGHFDGVV